MDTRSMELHLGILQSRLARLKGQMTACAAKINMIEADKDNKLGFDKEQEELKFAQYDKEYKEVDQALMEYESTVLELTKF